MKDHPKFPPSLFFDLKESSYGELFLETKEIWEVLKKLESYLHSLSLGKIDCEIPSSATLIHPHLISIGEGSSIGPGVCIEGPAFIGKNCNIRHAAFLRSYVLIGDHTTIGHASEVKHSVILSYSALPHFNYVGDSILGNRVNLGAGAVCANTRLDKQEIKVVIEGKKISTGLKKFGAIIGDDSMLGSHVVTNPGSFLLKKSFVKPCTSVPFLPK